MRIFISFLALSGIIGSFADPADQCQIFQTTDSRTPCYLFISVSGAKTPPFLYMLNLPRPSAAIPCPVSQTVDVTYSCYIRPTKNNDPDFILNVPLPPDTDELDESPSGKERLRQLKKIPLFKHVETRAFPPKSRELGPPSPFLTMAIFKPFAPSYQRPFTPISYNTLHQNYHSLLNGSPHKLPGPHYHVIHNERLNAYLPQHFQDPLLAAPVSYPYPSSEGSASINAFHGPYPPAV